MTALQSKLAQVEEERQYEVARRTDAMAELEDELERMSENAAELNKSILREARKK